MKFKVQGMTCGHCVKAVTRAIQGVDDSARVDVDLASGFVEVSGTITSQEAIKAIQESGYEAALASDRQQDTTARAARSCCGSCHT